MTTVYVTKWALTAGIQTKQASVEERGATVREWKHGWIFTLYRKDWHRTPEAAIARAEEMRLKKIASLKKSLAKMEALTFKVEE